MHRTWILFPINCGLIILVIPPLRLQMVQSKIRRATVPLTPVNGKSVSTPVPPEATVVESCGVSRDAGESEAVLGFWACFCLEMNASYTPLTPAISIYHATPQSS